MTHLYSVALAVLPITMGTGVARILAESSKAKKTEKALAGSSKYAVEAVASIRTVQALVREDDIQQHFNKELDDAAKAIQKLALYNGLIFAAA